MAERSWSLVERDSPEHALPADLAARDPLRGRDCGWVSPLRPLVRAFCPPQGAVFDPFCGFGTTLLAAALEQRTASGVEIDPARAGLARERLARHGIAAPVHDGTVADLPADARFDLALTNVPYFGAPWAGAPCDGQLYAAADHQAWLQGLRAVFHALRPHVVDGGHVVAMVGNVRVGDRAVAQAFDVARVLAGLYTALDERVLCYPPRAADTGPGAATTDRTHEYVLVFRKQRDTVDLAETVALLQALRDAGFPIEVHGSFAAWLADPAAREPADLDLRLPRDADHLTRLLAWLRARGFALTLWGEPLAAPPDLETLDRHHYLRAERLDRAGRLVRVDLALAAEPCGDRAVGPLPS